MVLIVNMTPIPSLEVPEIVKVAHLVECLSAFSEFFSQEEALGFES